MGQGHKPSPSPERAIYGFVLYLVSVVGFVVWVVWAYVPTSWLNAIGLTYWPQKYWAVAVPVYVCVSILLFYLTYLGVIFINTTPLDSLSLVTDAHANFEDIKNLPSQAIPPLRDMDLRQANKHLYLDDS